MEFLGINLNQWSLIIFVFSIINLASITFLFSKPLVRTILAVVATWIVIQILFIVYGYGTGQVGFMLLGICNMFIGILGAILKFGQEESEEDEDY